MYSWMEKFTSLLTLVNFANWHKVKVFFNIESQFVYSCELTILMKKDIFKIISKVDVKRITGVKIPFWSMHDYIGKNSTD